MINIAICDDEIDYINSIESYVSEFFANKGIEISIVTYTSADEFLIYDNKLLQYDIVFMDIEMEGTNGISAARHLRMLGSKAYLIFITSFIDYTLEGYKVEALRYIVKDFLTMKSGIYEALETVISKISIKDKSVRYEFVGLGEVSLKVDNIVYIEGYLHKTIFHIVNSDKSYYMYNKKISDIVREFDSPKLIRTHQSYAVNITMVSDIKRYQVSVNNISIPISKQYFNSVKEAYISSRSQI